MNGKRAKLLRRLALRITNSEGISGGTGRNRYLQDMNCIAWEPAYKDGHRHDYDDPDNNLGHERVTDPDGNIMLGAFYNPGTIRSKWVFRVVYRNLKREWKINPNAIYFQKGFINELLRTPIQKAN